MDKKTVKPKKWTQIYQQGTIAGDEEQRFFIYISRDAKYNFNSIADIALHCNLTKEQVENIISRYAKYHVLIQNPKNEDQWGYWERCEDLLPEQPVSLSKKDRDKRIAEFRKPS